MTLVSLSPILPELVLALATLALLLASAFLGRSSARRLSDAAIMVLIGIAAMIGATLYNVPEAMTAFGGAFVTDSLVGSFKVVLLIATALSLLMARGWLEREGQGRAELPVLVLFAVLGMMLMLSAGNLLVMYIALELQGLALYVLAAFQRDSARSSEAGLKYFILGALASGILLYGISLIYGFAGTIEFGQIAQTVSPAFKAVVVGFALILAGLLFKVAAVPFHMWAPDVYEGAPTPVTAFFSVAPKLAAVGLMIRLLYGPFAQIITEWQPLLLVVSAATMIIGTLGALGQDNIKRLLAYSSVGHVGFVLMGLATGTETGVSAVLLYLVFYVVMSLGAFAVVLAMRRNGQLVEGVGDLANMGQVHPGLAAAMAIFMFSMAGIPPLAGFFTKLYIFLAVLQQGLVWLAVVGVVTSVIGAYYYLRVVKIMYMDEPGTAFDQPLEPGLSVTAVVTGTLTLAGIVLLAPVGVLIQFALQSQMITPP